MKFFLLFLLIASKMALSAETLSPVVLMVGTRPEAIKVLPVYEALQSKGIPTVLCSTGQHRELLEEVFSLYGIQPDYDFQVMKPNQDLFYLTTEIMEKTKELFQDLKPSMVVVQGDTTSVMAATLAAFYLKIPVAHVEAGLRSGNLQRPFPEELNRRIVTLGATLHFAPTEYAAEALKREGVDSSKIFITGNPVVDALHGIVKKLHDGKLHATEMVREVVEANRDRKLILLTAHRRESFGEGLTNIFQAVKKALERDPNLFVIYPRHPNPNITEALKASKLDQMENIWITSSLPYQDLVYILDSVDGVATDSGGIQEEAVSLNKTTLVLREETDRPEAIHLGTAYLVGTEYGKVFRSIRSIEKSPPKKMDSDKSPYGDGHASMRIAHQIAVFLKEQS